MPLIHPYTSSVLKAETAAAERSGTLTGKQLDIIYREQWFSLFVPHAFGGLELSLPDGLRMEEALARIDGSLGWTVTLCSGASLFIGYLQPALGQIVFENEKVCFGGSGAVTGVAVKTEEGYAVTGHWKYATGATHNTVFTANCHIEKNGKLMLTPDGSPLIQSFLFLREEVAVHPDWNAMGLRATGSHSFSVSNLHVSAERCFVISPEQALLPQPIYRYPFLQLAEATIAVNTLGMTQHFVEECEALFAVKERIDKKRSALLQEAQTKLTFLRSRFYNAIDASWEELLIKGKSSEPALQKISKASRSLAAKARGLAFDLYPCCGMIAADLSTEINRAWRDLFTASQHNLLL